MINIINKLIDHFLVIIILQTRHHLCDRRSEQSFAESVRHSHCFAVSFAKPIGHSHLFVAFAKPV